MKAADYKDFCKNGKYGGKVLVQFKDPGTFTAMLGEDREISPMMIRAEQALMMMIRQMESQGAGEEQIAAMRAMGGPGAQPMQAVPMLIGELEIHGELLTLSYKAGETMFEVTICPDEIKHVTAAVNRHIHI